MDDTDDNYGRIQSASFEASSTYSQSPSIHFYQPSS